MRGMTFFISCVARVRARLLTRRPRSTFDGRDTITAVPAIARTRLVFASLLCASIALGLLTPIAAAAQDGSPMLLTGTGQGGGMGRAVSATNGAEVFSGLPFAPGFTGGVRVAAGDVNGDGLADLIVGSGPGAGLVRVFDGRDLTLLMSFAPFGGSFGGGVYVASGDLDGDGRADIIIGAGSGGTVMAISGADQHFIGSAFPFTPAYGGGVTVAAGDVDGDGRVDVIVGAATGGAVAVLSGVDAHVIAAGAPYGVTFTGGVNVASGDVNGDGRADVIVAPRSGGGLVQAFSGADYSVLASFLPYGGTTGAAVAAADIDGDGRADIITGPGAGSLPLVRIFSGADQHELNSFLVFDPLFAGGVFVAAGPSLRIQGAPRFTSSSPASWTVNTFASFSITAIGFPAATIALSGDLPSGLTFSGGTGTATISGTPTSEGTATVTLTATNALGVATQALTITIAAPRPPMGSESGGTAPAFTSAGGTTFTIGSAGSFSISTTGSPTPSITRTGALPTGVTFTDNGNGTAMLSGTPAAGSAGAYPLTLTASNGVGAPVAQSFTLTVNNSGTPIITSAAAATFTVGAVGSFAVTTTALPSVTSIIVTGALPSGLTFVDNGNGTGTLSGKPNPGSSGVYPLVFTASNGVGTTQNFTLTVNGVGGATPTITSANTTTFVVGSAGTFTITTTGSPTPAITRTGALPSGVTFTDNGDGTATMAGTPAAGSAGPYPLTFTADNGGVVATQSFTLTVNNASATPVFTSAPSAAFTIGAAGTFSITTAATPTVTTITQTGALPAGVGFTDNGNGTASLAGTPLAGSAGAYPITFTATNGVGGPVTQSFTLSVQQVASISSAASTTFTVGAAGTFNVTSTGTPTAALTRTGTLPTGVSFTDNGNGTATLGGTPAAGTG